MRSLIETKKFLLKIFMFVADNEREFTCLHVQIVEPYQTNYCCQFKSYLSLNKLRLFVCFALSKRDGAEAWQGMFCISKFTNDENSNM